MKIDHVAQNVLHTILLSFHDINSAYPLVTLKTFVVSPWQHATAKSISLCLLKINLHRI